MILPIPAVALCLVVAAAATPPPPTLVPASPPAFRASLAGRASAPGTPDEDAGEAWHLRARSFWRAGQRDSAVANYRWALARRGAHQDRLALADALLRRRAPGDTSEVISLLEPLLTALGGEGAGTLAAYQARLGWAEHLAGRPARALEYFAPLSDRLVADPAWRLRVAAATLAAGDYRRAYTILAPTLVASRRQDADAVQLLDQIAAMSGAGSQLDRDLERQIRARDARESQVLDGLGGRRVRFTATDGELVGAIALPLPSRARPRPVLVLMAPGDSLADYDSLAVALRRAGHAVTLIEPRGTGHSVSAGVPGPDTWDGRDEAMSARVARDVRDGLDALSRQAAVDTTRAAIVAVGASAAIAFEAAETDQRLVAIVLVSPDVEPVEQPVALDRAARLGLPVFVQSSPNDFAQRGFVEALLAAGDARASRSVETRAFVGGAAQFRFDPTLGRRIMTWLDEALSRRPPARATPRSPPRRG